MTVSIDELEDQARTAEEQRDGCRQHIEWTVETLKRGDRDEIPAVITRLEGVLLDLRYGRTP